MEKNILETFLANINTHSVLKADEQGNALVLIGSDAKSIIDLEKYAPTPSRIKELAEFDDLRGFIDYVNEFKTEYTACFAGSSSIKVIFDYHTKTSPRWGSHQAIFRISKSGRWKIWENAHNSWMSQREFANFLDSGLNEIIKPSQAEILSMVKNFRATTSYEFDSESTPYGGENLTFRKVTKTGTQLKEEVKLPEYITLALEPFRNLTVINPRLPEDKKIPAYQLQAKISWQASFADSGSDGLAFKVQILNVENVINTTLEIIKNAVVELTAIKVYIA